MNTFIFICTLVICLRPSQSQLSNPLADNKHISVDGNKFLQRAAAPAKKTWPSQNDEQDAASQCQFNLQLKWMAETTSSVYATPLITDLSSDGYKDIIVPSFVHYLEVFQGDNGAQASGFPAVHTDKVHASPLLHDIDHDGIRDIVVATYNGEILFYEDSGRQMPMSLHVPSLRVDKDWYVGLKEDDGTHKDVTADPDAHTVDTDVVGQKIHLDELRRQVTKHAESLQAAATSKLLEKNTSLGRRANATNRSSNSGTEGGQDTKTEDSTRQLLAEDDSQAGHDSGDTLSQEGKDATKSLRDDWPGLQKRMREAATLHSGMLNRLQKDGKKQGDKTMAELVTGATDDDDGSDDDSQNQFNYFDDYYLAHNDARTVPLSSS